MNDTVIQVENITKRYMLGSINRGTFYDELHYRWLKLRGKDVIQEMGEIGREIKPATEKEFWALKGVSFDVKQGEVVGLVGGNGAGKSTMLKVLTQITEPTSGRATIKGRIGSLLEVGTGFHPELTGRDNIYMNGAILGMKRNEITRKFDEIVDFSGVEQFLDTPVKRYSSGMYVRLAFAVAAHLETEVLLVDEVLAVGDAEFQKKCLGKMGEIASGGRTILFVSHNTGAIQELCSRCVLFNHGEIVKIGNTQDVLESYLDKGDTTPVFPMINDSLGINLNAVWTETQGDDLVVFLEMEGSSKGEAIGIAVDFCTNQGHSLAATPDRPAYECGLNGKQVFTTTLKGIINAVNPGKYRIGLDITMPGKAFVFRQPALLEVEIGPRLDDTGTVLPVNNYGALRIGIGRGMV